MIIRSRKIEEPLGSQPPTGECAVPLASELKAFLDRLAEVITIEVKDE